MLWPLHLCGGIPPYTWVVEKKPVIADDSRGVDVGQIRRQLRMSAPERVQSMVQAANVLLSIQHHARQSLASAD